MPEFPMLAHHLPDHYISRELLEFGIWEPYETELVLARLRPGSVFVYLGANIGYYTIAASLRCGEAGRVHAFEPEPGNFALLERNIALNGCANVRAVNAAAAERAGNAELFLSPINQGDHRLYGNEAGRASVMVPMISLDEYFAKEPTRIDLVKMDTQGSEARILSGMGDVITRNREWLTMIIEFWPFGLEGAGDSAARLAELLSPFGFAVSEIDEANRRLVPTSWEALIRRAATDLHAATQNFVNLLLSPAGQAA
jgi:FkbM family methyltransferase